MQTSVVGFTKLTTNLAMVEVLKKSKVSPNDVLQGSIKSISMTAESKKKRNNYNVLESTKYLLLNFPMVEELIVDGSMLDKQKCFEIFKTIVSDVKPSHLRILKFNCNQPNTDEDIEMNVRHIELKNSSLLW